MLQTRTTDMLFSGITFLYYFLPIVLILYLALPGRLKNIVLLIASLFFYAFGEPRYIVLMAATIMMGYVFGLLIEKADGVRKKAAVVAAVCLCLGILGIFKYADFFIGSFNQLSGSEVPLLQLALPIGISFYTFQLISYLIDVYRGSTEAQKDPVKLAVYISMFPQLIAGPIVRYVDVKERLDQPSVTKEGISYGISRFAAGLAKKVLIANTLGELCAVYKGLAQPTVLFSWVYAISTTLQIYFDFSGYSDMAIGLGSMLGFSFPENFRYPLTAKSVTEFWRRWHITLGSWFRDYLYIPLGGSRVRKNRHLFNILIVWLATGLWHGASWNFVLWGLFFAVLLMIEKYGLLKVLKKNALIGHFYLLFAVVISFVLFDHTDIGEGLRRIGYLFGGDRIPFSSAATWFYLKDYARLLLIAVIGATPLPKNLLKQLRSSGAEGALNLLEPFWNAALILISTAFLINGSFNPFLYFRF